MNTVLDDDDDREKNINKITNEKLSTNKITRNEL